MKENKFHRAITLFYKLKKCRELFLQTVSNVVKILCPWWRGEVVLQLQIVVAVVFVECCGHGQVEWTINNNDNNNKTNVSTSYTNNNNMKNSAGATERAANATWNRFKLTQTHMCVCVCTAHIQMTKEAKKKKKTRQGSSHEEAKHQEKKCQSQCACVWVCVYPTHIRIQ